MDKASGRLGRLRSYEFGEYQLAQEAQQRRRGKKKYQDDDHASGGGGDLPLSPPGWKDLATAGWERKQKHKQKYRAARAVTKMEAAAATAAVNLSGGDGDGDGEGGGAPARALYATLQITPFLISQMHQHDDSRVLRPAEQRPRRTGSSWRQIGPARSSTC